MIKLHRFSAVVVIIITAAFSVEAQTRSNQSIFGANLVLANPVGSFSDAYRTGFGVEGLAGIQLKDRLYATATLGYNSFKSESDNPSGNINITSVKGGLRYYASEKIFLTGNAGLGFAKDETEPKSYSRFIGDMGAGVHHGLVQAG